MYGDSTCHRGPGACARPRCAGRSDTPQACLGTQHESGRHSVGQPGPTVSNHSSRSQRCMITDVHTTRQDAYPTLGRRWHGPSRGSATESTTSPRRRQQHRCTRACSVSGEEQYTKEHSVITPTLVLYRSAWREQCQTLLYRGPGSQGTPAGSRVHTRSQAVLLQPGC